VTSNPAGALGFDKKGKIEVGADADVCIINVEKLKGVDQSPTGGAQAQGKHDVDDVVQMTFAGGRLLYEKPSK